MSAAVAVSKHMRDWLGTHPSSPPDEVFSMGVLSDGNPYGVPPGLVYSFPCVRGADGRVQIASLPGLLAGDGQGQGQQHQYDALLRATIDELIAERTEAESLTGRRFV